MAFPRIDYFQLREFLIGSAAKGSYLFSEDLGLTMPLCEAQQAHRGVVLSVCG